MKEIGRLERGALADLIVIPRAADPHASALLSAKRSDLSLVTVGGQPRLGSPAMRDAFAARGVRTRSLIVDEQPRIADATLVGELSQARVTEPGVTIA
jgi:5-methylthioadenosine/S-adenosylhomocysteine deaminase